MNKISTHVLDLSVGVPARGVVVRLERHAGGAWMPVANGATDADGRVGPLYAAEPLAPGTYRLTFESGAYFAAMGASTLYPEVSIAFTVEAGQSYHIPLLLSPYGFTTYRGT